MQVVVTRQFEKDVEKAKNFNNNLPILLNKFNLPKIYPGFLTSKK